MISSEGVCQPVEDRSGVFRKSLSARLATVALQALGRGSIPDDIALAGLSGV